MDMLKNGNIDMMSDVSMTPERKEQILFPSLPMGNESYYVFVDIENDEIIPGNYEGLNGKRLESTRAVSRNSSFWIGKKQMKCQLRLFIA